VNVPRAKGVILAGGQGTRFRPLASYFQKCRIPVGEEQKPVLEYIVRLFSHHDIKDLVLLVGYKHQQVKNYFNEGARFGVKIQYVLDRPEFSGSANALVNAHRLGAISKKDCLVVYYGDILSNFDLKEMVSRHITSKSAATLGLAHGFKVRVGTAEIKDGLVARFIEKPVLDLPVSVGIMVLSGWVLEEMNRLYEEGRKEAFDLMGDVVPHLIEKGIPVSPYISDGFWYDLGSLERYEAFENEGLSEKLRLLNEGAQPSD